MDQNHLFVQYHDSKPKIVASVDGEPIELTPHSLSTEFFKIIDGDPCFLSSYCKLTPDTDTEELFDVLKTVLKQIDRYPDRFPTQSPSSSLLTAFSKWLQLFGTKKLSDLTYGDYTSHAIYSAGDGDSLVYSCQTAGFMLDRYTLAFYIAPVPFGVLSGTDRELPFSGVSAHSTAFIPWLCTASAPISETTHFVYMSSPPPHPISDSERCLVDVDQLSDLLDRPLNLMLSDKYHLPFRVLSRFVITNMRSQRRTCLRFVRVPVVQASGCSKTHALVELCQRGEHPMCMWPLGTSTGCSDVSTYCQSLLSNASSTSVSNQQSWGQLKSYIHDCVVQTINAEPHIKNPTAIPIQLVKEYQDESHDESTCDTFVLNHEKVSSLQVLNLVIDEALAWVSDARLMLVGFSQAILEVLEELKLNIDVFLFFTATNGVVFDFLSDLDTFRLVHRFPSRDSTLKVNVSSLISMDTSQLKQYFLVLPIPFIDVEDVEDIVTQNLPLGDRDEEFRTWVSSPMPGLWNFKPSQLIGGCPPLFVARFIQALDYITAEKDNPHPARNTNELCLEALLVMIRGTGYRKVSRLLVHSQMNEYERFTADQHLKLARSLTYALSGYALSGLRLTAHRDLVATGCGALVVVRGCQHALLKGLPVIGKENIRVLRVERILGNVYTVAAIMFMVFMLSSGVSDHWKTTFRQSQTTALHQLVSGPAGVFGEGLVKGSVHELSVYVHIQNLFVTKMAKYSDRFITLCKSMFNKQYEDCLHSILSMDLDGLQLTPTAIFEDCASVVNSHSPIIACGTLPPIQSLRGDDHVHSRYIGRVSPGEDFVFGGQKVQVKVTSSLDFFESSKLDVEMTQNSYDLLVVMVPTGQDRQFLKLYMDSQSSYAANVVILSSPAISTAAPDMSDWTSYEYGTTLLGTIPVLEQEQEQATVESEATSFRPVRRSMRLKRR